MSDRLSFDELRTRWITAVSSDPEVRAGALKLLYKQPLSEHLPEVKILSLKRIVETAFDDDPEDWTVEMELQEQTTPTPVVIEKPADTKRVISSRESSSTSAVKPSIFERRPASVESVKQNDAGSAELAPGQIINGRYVLEEPLGRGGAGIVFRARDRLRQQANAATDEIAIKFLRSDFRSDERRVASLRQETLLTQSLSHPNIVRVYDFHEGGKTHFLTMELLHGELLRVLFSRTQPTVVSRRRAERIITGMCRGLAYAHANGCVHADFKPGNVFLAEDDEPKILDFGLARGTPSGPAAIESASGSGSSSIRANTPVYASCNRLEGGDPVFNDDVYSLSCVIYELLAGCHPYQRKLATEARAEGLKPERINYLSDPQWRTLEGGLQLAGVGGNTKVEDLLRVFRSLTPSEPSPAPAAKRRVRSWTLFATVSAFLVGAGVILAIAILGIQPIDSRILDALRDSTIVRTVQSSLGIETDEAGGTEGSSVPTAVRDTQAETGLEIESGLPIETGLSIETGLPIETGLSIETGIPAPGEDTMTPPNESLTAEEAVETAAPAATEYPDPLSDTVLSDEADKTDQADSALLPETGQGVIAASGDVPGFRLGSSMYYINEKDTALAIEISRQGDVSESSMVALTTYGGTAEADVDFVSFRTSYLRFEAGEVSKTFFVPIVNDPQIESDELFEVGLSTTNAQSVLVEPSNAAIIIVDDDA